MHKMSFPAALNLVLVNGTTISREGWNGKGQFVSAQHPDDGSLMDCPYLYLTNTEGKRVPWLPSQGDLFATDWYTVTD